MPRGPPVDAEAVRAHWHGRTAEYSPEYYAYHGPNATSEAVRSALERLVEPGDPVLEVGCSAGRHLEHLRTHGFSALHGLDVNPDAADVMAEAYPELAAAATVHTGPVGELAPTFADRRFGAVFSVRTLQHLHPDEVGVVQTLARIADAVVTVERETPGEDVAVERVAADGVAAARSEGTAVDGRDIPVSQVNGEFPLYYRDWGAILDGLGLVAVESRAVRGDTLRAFRHPE